jgi:hypothetical protein
MKNNNNIVAYLDYGYSMGAIMFLNIEERICYENSTLMQHNYSMGGYGKGGELKDKMEYTDRQHTQWRKLLIGFITEEEYREMELGKDLYFSALDMAKRGMVTKVNTKIGTVTAEEYIKMSNTTDREDYIGTTITHFLNNTSADMRKSRITTRGIIIQEIEKNDKLVIDGNIYEGVKDKDIENLVVLQRYKGLHYKELMNEELIDGIIQLDKELIVIGVYASDNTTLYLNGMDITNIRKWLKLTAVKYINNL